MRGKKLEKTGITNKSLETSEDATDVSVEKIHENQQSLPNQTLKKQPNHTLKNPQNQTMKSMPCHVIKSTQLNSESLLTNNINHKNLPNQAINTNGSLQSMPNQTMKNPPKQTVQNPPNQTMKSPPKSKASPRLFLSRHATPSVKNWGKGMMWVAKRRRHKQGKGTKLLYNSICKSVFLFICLSVRLSFCPSAFCPSVFLSVCLSVRLSFCPSIRLPYIYNTK